jgi:hypothetical protein
MSKIKLSDIKSKIPMPPVKPPKNQRGRTIVQIESCNHYGLVALCDDGTLWRLVHNEYSKAEEWEILPDIPQKEIK